MEVYESQTSLEEVFEEDCARRNVDIDIPLMRYRKFISSQPNRDENKEARLQVKSYF